MESVAARFDAACTEMSDIRDALPRLHREARGTILELGVRGGNSTAALLRGVELRGGVVWSVDVEAECAETFAGHPQWHFVLADSRDASFIRAAGVPETIDVLFVDTLHTYAQVTAELDAWGPSVARGGRILFHDTDLFVEVRRAVHDWCSANGMPHEFLPLSTGLGVAYPGRGRAFQLWLLATRIGRRLRRAGELRRVRRSRPATPSPDVSAPV